ncbi:Homeodomain GLABROUS 2 isoform 1 [Hibiscus syriacus]|uniref:Homeodomain GLABROUS 2 isoform 1 n=1 Tax=Hibiscus syriacus TaxID=106335 RepID=A0A6A2XPE3_HIBSY|nr:vascular-related unknown protein 1-like isoform X1 [Hibiscus syriacus]KAE8663896.1 Homeodomain GLABROUS 2 isoform 1 [Hibiscus syriacus]
MEHYSINSSSVSKPKTTPKEEDDSVEESGWTAYFVDSSNSNHRTHDHRHHHQQQSSYCSSFVCGSSLVSDAATTRRGAAWKPSDKDIDRDLHVFPEKVRFKKTRTKEIRDEEDDSLEDTASSPVNSPKVSDDWISNDMNPRKREDQAALSSLGKDGAENCSDIHIEEENKLSFHDGKNDCTEISKRGLRLVPFSMLVNYIG